MRAFLPAVRRMLDERAPAVILAAVDDPSRFYIALVGATLSLLIVVLLATTGRPSPLKARLVVFVQAIFLLNVFLPHVPAAIALGGYAPGVGTAVLINLPFSIYFFRRSVREGVVSANGLAITLGLALLALILFVPVLFIMAGVLT